MKKINFIISLICATILSFNAKAEDWVACGTDGNGNTANCEYKVENNRLTIRGTNDNGNLGNWASLISPWSYRTFDDIEIESSIKDLGSHAFHLTESHHPIVVPDSIHEISSGAFDGTHAPEVIIPDSVTTIKPMAFYHSFISSVIIPDSIEAVGNSAFAELNSDMEIFLGDTTVIGARVIDATRVTHIYCTGDAETCKENVNDAYKDKIVAAEKKKINGVTYITDKNGKIIKTSGKRNNKRIYSIEEANATVKAIGKDRVKFRIRYK